MNLPIVYINLARRSDRNMQIKAEFDKLGVSAIRYEAVECKPGVVGCMKSHLGVLEMAQEQGWECVMVCEDDSHFKVSKDQFRETVNHILQEKDWNIVLGGYNDIGTSFEKYNKLLSKVFDAQAYCCYIIHSRYYNSFKAYLEYCIEGMINTGRHWEYAIDQYCKRFQRKDKWLACVPKLAKQRGGMSDAGHTPRYISAFDHF